MIKAEHTIAIQAPVEEVFSTVTTIENTPRWVSVVKSVRATSGSLGAGATFTETAELMGQTAAIDKVVTVYDAPRTYAVRSTSGPVVHSITMSFTPDGDTTLVRLVLEAEEPSGMMALMSSMVLGVLKSLLDGDLARLKQLIEKR